jgi:uncharacterized protein (TIGR03382 family)
VAVSPFGGAGTSRISYPSLANRPQEVSEQVDPVDLRDVLALPGVGHREHDRLAVSARPDPRQLLVGRPISLIGPPQPTSPDVFTVNGFERRGSMAHMNRAFPTAVLALALASPALAWEHEGFVWPPEALPLPYCVQDDGACDETLPTGDCVQAAVDAFDLWAPCVDFSAIHQGACAPEPDAPVSIVYGDPGDVLGVGVLAHIVVQTLGSTRVLDGRTYEEAAAATVVVNDDVRFVTDEDIAAGRCEESWSLPAVLAHEVGHVVGLSHGCDPDECPLPPPPPPPSVMAAPLDPCAPSLPLHPDDVEGLHALYGLSTGLDCSHQDSDGTSVGAVPFDLHCVVAGELPPASSVEWRFGDGSTDGGLAVTHTYGEPGNYRLELWVDGASCAPVGGWRGVRACGAPEPRFQVVPLDGLRVRLANESEVPVAGCLSEIVWTVRRGEGTGGEVVLDGIDAWEPEVELPGEGRYTVTMHLGGIGGTRAAAASFDARSGCSTAGGGGSAAVALALLAAGRRRRPRHSRP